MAEKLKIGAVLREAGVGMIRNLRPLLPMIGFLLLFRAAELAAESVLFGGPSPDGGMDAALLVFGAFVALVFYTLLLPAATSLQRLILIGLEARIGFAYQHEEWLVARAITVISALVLAWLAPAALVVIGVGTAFPQAIPGFLVLLGLLLLLAFFRVGRVFVVMPAGAIGRVLHRRDARAAMRGEEAANGAIWLIAFTLVLALPILSLAVPGIAGRLLEALMEIFGALYLGAVAAIIFRRRVPLAATEAIDSPKMAQQGMILSLVGILLLAAAVLFNALLIEAYGGVDGLLAQLSALSL